MQKAIIALLFIFSIWSQADAAFYNFGGPIDESDPYACQSCSPLKDCFDCLPLFDIHLDILFLRPTSNHLNYAVETHDPTSSSPDWKVYSLDPDYQIGFQLGLTGRCYGISNLTIDWQHFYSKHSRHQERSSDNLIGPIFEALSNSIYRTARGKAIFHFDSFDLTYGGYTQDCEEWQANLYAGINATQIRQTFTSKFSSLDRATVRRIKIPSSFVGAGPQLGLQTFYTLMSHLQLTGELAASLLVGHAKSHASYQSISPALSDPNKQRLRTQTTTHVVPAFKGKIGLAFYSCLKTFSISVETGYQVQVYVNAIHSIDIGSLLTTANTTGVFARNFQKTTTNFSLSGPYARINFSF